MTSENDCVTTDFVLELYSVDFNVDDFVFLFDSLLSDNGKTNFILQ